MSDINTRVSEIEEKLRRISGAHPRFETCQDCESYVPGYMVTDEVWKSAGLDRIGSCCFKCLSVRLKRELIIEDFTDTPINYNLLVGYQISKLE